MPAQIGFYHPDGVPFDQRLCESWSRHFEVRGAAFCFRVHEMERDGPEASKAVSWARGAGMEVYLSLLDYGGAQGFQRLRGLEASMSVGNSVDWEALDVNGDHLQDDSGPVGFAHASREWPDYFSGKAFLLHAYGQSGFRPAEAFPLLAKRARDVNCRLVWMEGPWGFPGKDKTIGDRPDVVSAGAGLYARAGFEEARRYGIKVAVYTPRYFLRDSGELNAAGLELAGVHTPGAEPNKPPLMKALWMEARLWWLCR